MTTIMQPFQCDLQPQIPKHPITTHAQAHPKQLEATVTMRQKKQTDRSRNRRTQEVPFIAGCSHFTWKNTKGFVLQLPPQHKPRATFMQPLQCVSQHHVANLHVSTHMATPDDNNHAAIPMRSATTDSKTSHNYARTSTPKATWSHRYNAAKKKQTDRSRNHRTQEVPFIVGCSHFTRKNARSRAPASSPTQAPCNIHAAITMRFAASRRKPARIYAYGNTRWQQSCSHSNAICNRRFQNTP